MNLKIRGLVIEGKKEGRRLGFPTANILLPSRVSSGVYAGKAFFDGKNYTAALFIPKEENMLEAYILGWSGDLYEKEIEIEIQEKLRDIEPFQSDSQMRSLINKDIEVITKSKVNENSLR